MARDSNKPRGVRAIDSNTSSLVATFPNLRAVAKVGRNPGDVWMCTVGRRHTHHGLRWIRDPAARRLIAGLLAGKENP